MQPTLIQQSEDIQLNNQYEVDQILGNPPNWLMYWGISLVFICAVIFIALAWLIKYPDVIEANVQILTENPAIRLVPLTSGKITELLVENQEIVNEKDLLAVIESPVVREDVLRLEKLILQLENTMKKEIFYTLNLDNHLMLGSMQNQYASLLQKIEDHQYYLRQNNTQQKIEMLTRHIKHMIELNENIKKQRNISTSELVIIRRNYERNKQLNKEGIVSDMDLEQFETTYLQYQRQIDQFKMQVINNQIQIDQLQTQIQELRLNREEGQNVRLLAIKENLQNLKSQLSVWKQTYLIHAPITGKVSFSKVWTANQYSNAGEELLTIVPLKGRGKKMAKALLPLDNSGKVKTGSLANIKLNGYPYQEFGIIKSTVKQIALVPQEEHYQMELMISDTLVTTYGKVIPFRQEMEGTVAIITEERRILQRIFDRIYSIIKNT